MGLKVGGRLLLTLLLCVTAGLAARSAPKRMPAPGAETTNWLAAHSLAVDRDELFVDADATRFRTAFGETPRGVRSDPHGGRLEAPYFATRLWAGALAVAGERGPFLANALALALAAVAASWALRAPLGAAAPLWVAIFLFGSVAFTSVFRWESEILVFSVVVLAGALVWGREDSPLVTLGTDQMYGGDLERRSARWPLPVAGLLIGAAAVRHPAYALIALPMLSDLPRSGARAGWVRAGGLFLLPFLLPVGFVLAAHVAPWESPAMLFHPALLGWNALYLVVGRHAGLIVGFLPVLALLLSPRQTGGRRFLPLAVMVAAVAQLLLSPFDWAGDLQAVGNPWFLPLYGALIFCAGSALHLRSALLVGLAVVPFVAPFWLAPLSDGTRAPRPIDAFTSRVREWLPFETTLRDLPGSAELARAAVRLRGTGPAIRTAGGRLALESSSAGLLVESDRALSSLRLDFSANAPATLAVDGGTTGSTTFRPNGEVAFEITLGQPARRHPLWWSRAPVSIYMLHLNLPEAASRIEMQSSRAVADPVTFDLGLARVAGPEAARP